MALLSTTYYQHTGIEIGSTSGSGTVSFIPSPFEVGDRYAERLVTTSSALARIRFGARSADGARAAFSSSPTYAEGPITFTEAPAANNEEFAAWTTLSGATRFVQYRLNSARKVEFYDGDALGGNTPTSVTTAALTLNTPYWFQLKMTPGGAATASELHIRTMNNTLVETLDCTGHWSDLSTAGLVIGRFFDQNGQNLSMNVGGWFAFDDSWKGPLKCRTAYRRVSGPGFYQASTAVGNVATDSERWRNLRDLMSESEYLTFTSATAGDAFTCTVEPFSGTAPDIYGVIPICLTKDHTGGADAVQQTRLRSGSTDSDTTDRTIGIASTELYGVYRTTDPSTSAAWTLAGVNAAQVGVEFRSTADFRFYSAGMLMAYDGSTGQISGTSIPLAYKHLILGAA